METKIKAIASRLQSERVATKGAQWTSFAAYCYYIDIIYNIFFLTCMYIYKHTDSYRTEVPDCQFKIQSCAAKKRKSYFSDENRPII